MFRIKACEGIYHYLSLKLISSHFYFKLIYSTFNIPSWSSVVTAVSIPSTIAVYGNGKTLGFSDDKNNYSILPGSSGSYYSTSAYNKNIGGTASGTDTRPSSTRLMGITKNTNGTSGIVAKSNSITRTVITKKYIIKY